MIHVPGKMIYKQVDISTKIKRVLKAVLSSLNQSNKDILFYPVHEEIKIIFQ